MIEVKSDGNWPLNTISDVNKARAELEAMGHFTGHHLVGAPHRIKSLDTQIPDTLTTVRRFLLSNNLVDGIIEANSIKNQDDVFLIWYEVSFIEDLEVKVEAVKVRITDIVFKYPPPPRTLNNAELLKRLRNAPTRDVVREAALRMFQSLQGSAKNE